MSIPKCHRTISANVVRIDQIGDDPGAWFDHEPRACIGSTCAMWVPKIQGRRRADIGRCADNPNREPWPDPAKGGDDA